MNKLADGQWHAKIFQKDEQYTGLFSHTVFFPNTNMYMILFIFQSN